MEDSPVYKSAKFIKRLFEIVSNDAIATIGWSPNGRSFIIHNKDLFLKETLPLISKTREYSGFVRLLNHYGFTKLNDLKIFIDSSNGEEYYHPNFIKGKPQNLTFITRTSKIKSKEISLTELDTDQVRKNMEFLNKNSYLLNKEIEGLKEKIEDQGKTISGLIEVLSRVFNMGIQSKKAIQNDNKFDSILEKEEFKKSKRRLTIEDLEREVNIDNMRFNAEHFSNVPQLKNNHSVIDESHKINEIKALPRKYSKRELMNEAGRGNRLMLPEQHSDDQNESDGDFNLNDFF